MKIIKKIIKKEEVPVGLFLVHSGGGQETTFYLRLASL